MSRWEKGISIPSNERIKTLSDKFHVSTLYLLEGEKTIKDLFPNKELDDYIKGRGNSPSPVNLDSVFQNTFKDEVISFFSSLDVSQLSVIQLIYLSSAIEPLKANYNDDYLYMYNSIFDTLDKLPSNLKREELNTLIQNIQNDVRNFLS
ncbi:hypothetical protein RV02_GL000036 [Enterococcus gilvus]|nr:hypothetical protein RV02_GL000036 [Enterococcus gilvus]